MNMVIFLNSKSTRMGVTFTKLGLHPGMAATHFLPALVGPQVMGQFFGDENVIQVSTFKP